jgi:hypothetical protein
VVHNVSLELIKLKVVSFSIQYFLLVHIFIARKREIREIQMLANTLNVQQTDFTETTLSFKKVHGVTSKNTG